MKCTHAKEEYAYLSGGSANTIALRLRAVFPQTGRVPHTHAAAPIAGVCYRRPTAAAARRDGMHGGDAVGMTSENGYRFQGGVAENL